MRFGPRLICAGVLGFGIGFGPVAAAAPDRSFITDRPSFANNPLTMAAGHDRVEVTLASDEISDRARLRNYGSFYAVHGVGPDVELQFGVDGYQVSEFDERVTRGFGVVDLGFKYNLVGNAGERFAAGVMPKLQYEGTGNYGGEVSVPLGFRLNSSWQLFGTLQYGFTTGHEPGDLILLGLVPTLNVNERLSVFAQYGKTLERGRAGAHLVGVGGAYLVNDRWQLDAEVNRGVVDSEGDWQVVLGLAAGFAP